MLRIRYWGLGFRIVGFVRFELWGHRFEIRMLEFQRIGAEIMILTSCKNGMCGLDCLRVQDILAEFSV